MGKHLSAGAAPAGSGPGDPLIPVDPCMVEVKQKQAVNKAPKQEVIVEITPNERKKGIEPIEPKKLPELFKPCGKLHIGIWENELGDPLPGGEGKFTPVDTISIETTEYKIMGPIIQCVVHGKNPAYLALDRVVPDVSFENMSDADIVQSLVSSLAPEIENRDINNCGVDFSNLAFNHIPLIDALNHIAFVSDAVWFVDGPNNKLVFQKTDAQPNPNPVTTRPPSEAKGISPHTEVREDPVEKEKGREVPNIKTGSTKVEEDKQEVVNEIIVVGGAEDVPHYEEDDLDVGTEKHLSYPPVGDSLRAQVFDGVSETIVSLIEARSGRLVGPQGSGITGVFCSAEKNIVLDHECPGCEIHMQYDYRAPVYFSISNPDSIARWGLRQRVIVDPQMKNIDQTLKLAERILDEYSAPVLRGSCEVHNGELFSIGDTVFVHMPEINISQSMLISAIERDIHRVNGRTTRLHFGKPRRRFRTTTRRRSTSMRPRILSVPWHSTSVRRACQWSTHPKALMQWHRRHGSPRRSRKQSRPP